MSETMSDTVEVEDLQANITKVARILMAVEGMSQQELAAAISLDGSAVSRSFKGRRKWATEDVAALSKALGRPVGAFYQPAELLFDRAVTRGYRSDLVAA